MPQLLAKRSNEPQLTAMQVKREDMPRTPGAKHRQRTEDAYGPDAWDGTRPAVIERVASRSTRRARLSCYGR